MDSRTKKHKIDTTARDESNRSYQEAQALQADGFYNHALGSYEAAAGALSEIPTDAWTRSDFLNVMKILGKMLGLIANNKIDYPHEPNETELAYNERVWKSTTHRINSISGVMSSLSVANARANAVIIVPVAPLDEPNIEPVLAADTSKDVDVVPVAPPVVATDAHDHVLKSPAAYRYSEFERAFFYLSDLDDEIKNGQPLFTADGPTFK